MAIGDGLWGEKGSKDWQLTRSACIGVRHAARSVTVRCGYASVARMVNSWVDSRW